MLVERIISGGQTGADRGGLDAALELGIAHGGFCPKGRLAEDGQVPAIYQLEETADNDYRTRTRLNVEAADLTLICTLEGGMTGGSLFTKQHAVAAKKPWAHVSFGVLSFVQWPAPPSPADLERAQWLRDGFIELEKKLGRSLIINVAGNRESKSPGIHRRTRELLVATLRET